MVHPSPLPYLESFLQSTRSDTKIPIFDGDMYRTRAEASVHHYSVASLFSCLTTYYLVLTTTRRLTLALSGPCLDRVWTLSGPCLDRVWTLSGAPCLYRQTFQIISPMNFRRMSQFRSIRIKQYLRHCPGPDRRNPRKRNYRTVEKINFLESQDSESQTFCGVTLYSHTRGSENEPT
jgi:hypothetical protein